jgi:predicted metalloprotease with PDZ domain
LIDPARYLKLVAKTATGVLGMPGRKLQSVAQSSFDAWVKYYRTDENTPNATISYYTKGSLVALAFDLTLRAAGRSLDDVMRALWQQSRGGPIDETDILRALAAAAGRPLADELQAFVHGTDDLPLQALLERAGVQWQAAPAGFAQRLGLRVSESALTGVKATHVLRGGAAEAAGVSVGDELLAVEGWRIRRIDEAERLLAPGRSSELLVVREQRVLRLALEAAAPGTASTITLAPAAAASADAQALRKAWLGG